MSCWSCWLYIFLHLDFSGLVLMSSAPAFTLTCKWISFPCFEGTLSCIGGQLNGHDLRKSSISYNNCFPFSAGIVWIDVLTIGYLRCCQLSWILSPLRFVSQDYQFYEVFEIWLLEVYCIYFAFILPFFPTTCKPCCFMVLLIQAAFHLCVINSSLSLVKVQISFYFDYVSRF